MVVNPQEMEGKDGLELLALGMKAFEAQRFADAAAILSKSSEVLVEEHKDDKHNTLGNVYLYYGKSLLELSREESDPLGEGVPKEVGVEVEGDEEGDGDLSDSNPEGLDDTADGEADADADEEQVEDENSAEVAAEAEKEKTNGSNGIQAETEEKDANTNGDQAEAEAEDNEEELVDDAAPEDGGEGTSAEKAEEEPTDLQLAWEVLELAKIILERRGEEGQEDYSECLVTLGEVSMENENFDSAIADITAGLEIQKKIFKDPLDMRKLAQSFYKLGLAYTAHNKLEDGIANYQKAVDILRERLVQLEAIEEPGSTDKIDIKDIKAILPELEEKIADLKTYKEEVEKKAAEESASSNVQPSPEKKANDISHLVKRKRKIDEVAADTAETAAKKMASS